MIAAFAGTFAVAFPALFFIVDPVGVVPIFVAITGQDSPDKCRRTALKATVSAALLLTFFALFGALLFRLFGVTISAFRVAGGLLLMLTALDMLRAQPAATRTSDAETREGVERTDVALVPLAMPLLAGPGAIATSMVLMAEHGKTAAGTTAVLASIALTALITYVLLASAQVVKRALGQTGIAVVERVFGLLLATVAVQFIFDGAKALLFP